jgi:hypothetical protein
VCRTGLKPTVYYNVTHWRQVTRLLALYALLFQLNFCCCCCSAVMFLLARRDSNAVWHVIGSIIFSRWLLYTVEKKSCEGGPARRTHFCNTHKKNYRFQVFRRPELWSRVKFCRTQMVRAEPFTSCHNRLPRFIIYRSIYIYIKKWLISRFFCVALEADIATLFLIELNSPN